MVILIQSVSHNCINLWNISSVQSICSFVICIFYCFLGGITERFKKFVLLSFHKCFWKPSSNFYVVVGFGKFHLISQLSLIGHSNVICICICICIFICICICACISIFGGGARQVPLDVTTFSDRSFKCQLKLALDFV